MSYNPDPGYDYEGQRDPYGLPDPDFDNMAWLEICWRLDYLQQESDRRAEEEFLMNVWYEQYYAENPSERDY